MVKSEIAGEEALRRAGLAHRVHIPANVEGKKQPCLLMVHGRAGNFGVMWIFSKAVGSTRPLIIVAPQAHLTDPIGGHSWWEIGQTPSNPNYPECTFSEMYLGDPLERLGTFIDSLPSLYNVDNQRIVAFGFSQGAGLISAMSVARPGVFKAMALLAGFVPKTAKYQLSQAASLQLPSTFVFHGTEDKILPFERAKRDAEFLEQHGAPLRFEQDSVGHKVSSAGIRALGDWYQSLDL